MYKLFDEDMSVQQRSDFISDLAAWLSGIAFALGTEDPCFKSP
jgi:hypothetical protein